MRKELLTHPRLQAKWLGLILVLVGLSAILVYVSIDRAIAMADASANGAFLTGDWLRGRIQAPFYIASLIALVGAGCVALFQLHTLLGPIKNLETAFQRVQDGNLKEPFATRQADELQDLAASFRAMQESLRARVLKDRERAAALKVIIDESLAKLPPDAAKLKEDLSFVSKELETLTSHFDI